MANKEGFLRLSEAPFLKYLISFVAGTILQMIMGNGYYVALPFVLLSFTLFYYHYTSLLPKTKYKRRRYFGYATFSLFIALGSVNAEFSTLSQIILPQKNDYIIAELSDNLSIKERSVEGKATIIQYNRDDDKLNSHKILLYFETDSLSENLKKGDIVIFENNLQPIKFSKNPFSIDYATILNKNGFEYSQYLTKQNWMKIDHSESNSLKDKALTIKTSLTEYLNSLTLSYNSKALINAMILGDTSLLTDLKRNNYSAAGLSHILAVSGLHIGIICWIIYALLYPLKFKRLSFMRPLITLIILWAYIFVIGFPASGVRAAIMVSFVLVGEIFNRKGTTINSLLCAALLMICFNPNYLYDVGFQLSFMAVFSIFYIYPFIYSHLPQKNKLLSYLSSIISVTLAAQIGTLPLSLYYFQQLPLFGIITNILIIPILPIIVVIGIISLILPLSFVLTIADFSFNYIDYIAKYSASLPYSSINIYIEGYYIVFSFIIIYMIVWAIKSKRSELIVLTLSLITLFILVDRVFNYNDLKYKAVIYDDNKITAINFIDDNYNYIITPDTINVGEKVNYIAKNFWIKNALPDAIFKNDSISDNNLYLYMPYISYKGEKYIVLNSDKFKNKKLSHGKRLYIDKAIICEGFSGSISSLTNMFIFEEIIIASNLNYFKRKSIIKECQTLKIPYYDIKEKGAYLIRE